MAQTVDEPVVHGIVHDIGHPEGVTLGLDCSHLGLSVLAYEILRVVSIDGLAAIDHDASGGVFLCKASDTTDGLHAAIGAGSGDIVLQQDALPFDGADERIVDTYVVGHICGRSERYEVVEPVATMDM